MPAKLRKGATLHALGLDRARVANWYEIKLGAPFSKGGAAQLWHVEKPGLAIPLVAKIWNKRGLEQVFSSTLETTRVLRLVENRNQLHIHTPTVVWPRRLLLTQPTQEDISKYFRGFTMSRLDHMRKLHQILALSQQGQSPLTFDQSKRMVLMLCETLQKLHDHPWQFRIGDFSANNIMFSEDLTKMAFVDADSFQFLYPNRETGTNNQFRATGFTLGYSSPKTVKAEFLLKAGDPVPLVDEQHDQFVLAIHIYQIYMAHLGLGSAAPFQKFERGNENDAIAAGRFVHDLPKDHQPNDFIQQQYLRIPPPIREAFSRTFARGKPLTTREWADLCSTHWRSLQP